MDVIYKYEIPVRGATIEMPEPAFVIHLEVQHGRIMAWVLQSSNPSKFKERKFVTVETGMPFIAEGLDWHGTVLLHGGDYVVHVFEDTKEKP